ncbi:MAG: hypothetical protein ACE5KZ_08455 [Candidatus Scalinduaceae bacterium]
MKKEIGNILPLIPQLIEYHNSSIEDRQSYQDHTKDPIGNRDLYEDLKRRLLNVGILVEEVDINISDFENWLSKFSEIKDFYHKGDTLIEKCLEHYLAFKFTKISDNDTYIDIGGSGSPWVKFLNQRGIRSYRLDLEYPEGINGSNIGADAANTKLPDSFATVLSLQCAYEHFMGKSDIQFVREADRILNEKGRYGIIPLYLDDTYFNVTSPYCDQKSVQIDNEAKRIWRDDEYRLPFARFYSPESFKKRIYSNIPKSMNGKVLYFRNLPEVMKHFKGQRIYCYFMFFCAKQFATF